MCERRTLGVRSLMQLQMKGWDARHVLAMVSLMYLLLELQNCLTS